MNKIDLLVWAVVNDHKVIFTKLINETEFKLKSHIAMVNNCELYSNFALINGKSFSNTGYIKDSFFVKELEKLEFS